LKIDLEGAVNEIVEEITYQAKSRAFRAANELRNSALTVLRGKRSGRVYKRPFSKSKYTASAPGEPPAMRTGNLRMSWRPQSASERIGNTVTIKPAITTEVKYAPYLEEGTDRMAPRPFKDPIIEKAMPRISQIFKEPY
jgi:hypothetical protein